MPIFMDVITLKNSIQKLFRTLFFAALISLSTLNTIYADTLSDRIEDVKTSETETDLVNSILRLSIPVATLSLFGLGVYAAYLMMTSQGNPEKLGEAREVVTNAVLGFAMIGLSVAILLLIQDVLKIPGVNP